MYQKLVYGGGGVICERQSFLAGSFFVGYIFGYSPIGRIQVRGFGYQDSCTRVNNKISGNHFP
jgi:hypothetical protein